MYMLSIKHIFLQKYKCRYNGIQKAIDRGYKELVYDKISISN